MASDRRSQMESIFFPLVKPDMLEKFKKTWHNWICLSNDVAEEKTPGLLKVEFLPTGLKFEDVHFTTRFYFKAFFYFKP